MSRRGEVGQVTAFVAIIMVTLLLAVGLVIDGGLMLAARREADDVAGNAARAGAQAVSVDRLRSDNAQVLDHDSAAAATRSFLDAEGYEGRVSVSGDAVTVTVVLEQPLVILGIAGMTSRTVEGTGTARTVRGLDEGET